MHAFLVPSIAPLIFYALWAIALVLMVGADRVLQIVTGKAEATAFTPGSPHGSDAYWRLNRAHLNTIENLPVFATIVLSAYVVGQGTATFNHLATVVVCARIIQSVIHIFSGSATAIAFRFTAYGIQLICEIWMAALVLHAGGLF
ncbi:MAG: MAPEG family protein [Rhizomicrobium sp.]|jgi:uncharacterized MAPEG superfamily protein